MPTQKPSVLIAASEREADRISSLVKEQCDPHILTPPDADCLLERIGSSGAEAVFIDSDLRDFDWPSAVYRICRSENNPPVVVLGNPSDRKDLLTAFREGADAFIRKKNLRGQLIDALKAVRNGQVFWGRKDAAEIREHLRYLELGSARSVVDVEDGIRKLTLREKEVFPLLADGKSIKEVAVILGISPKTVETHKYHIMEKLDLDSMADFTKLAMIKDLLPLERFSPL